MNKIMDVLMKYMPAMLLFLNISISDALTGFKKYSGHHGVPALKSR
jgi:hypothetical protein